MMRRMRMAAGIAGLLAFGIGCDFAAQGGTPQQPCGGPGDAPCATGTVCEDDPGDDCDPHGGGKASCPGLCEPAPCGPGMLGGTCPEGQVCIDDPDDDCEATSGATVCPGVCAGGGSRPVACADPDRTFVSHSQDLCAQILFICEVGWVPFYDGCGCGCEPQERQQGQ